METTPLVAQEAHALSIPDTHVTVSFNNVSFAYPGSASPTLKNISFTIASGEKIALVGLNGAGKTTLLRLLLRMYDVTEGSITVNGIDIRQLNLTQWYEKLSLMFQDCQDYEYLSLREASTLFVKNIVSDERILETFKQVMGEDIASTSADLDVMQTPQYGGKELSGGQFQKVALVRTLLKDAPLIILDEPTSAIDALSEEHIFNGLHNLAKDRTLLFVSHRFTTIRNADRIIVLNNGTVDADGTHEELMKSHGLYEKMYKTQVLGEKS